MFPELREWLRVEAGVGLVEIDLRWGVPAESSGSDTLELCLGELRRVSEESGGRPFLLGLLGHRYGWIPSAEDFGNWKDEILSLSLTGRSMTHLEMTFGALSGPSNPNAVFALRHLQPLHSLLPSHIRDRWIDESQTSMDELKGQIKSTYSNQSFEYAPSGGSQGQNAKVKLACQFFIPAMTMPVLIADVSYGFE